MRLIGVCQTHSKESSRILKLDTLVTRETCDLTVVNESSRVVVTVFKTKEI